MKTDEYEKLINNIANSRKGSGKEKLKNDDQRKTHNKSRIPKADKRDHPRFKVTIKFTYADNRRRDNNNGAATLLDCLVDALHGL